jgi:hypothetical protein
MLGTADLWPWLLACTVVPGIIQSLLLPWCPESPSYLYIDKKDEPGAVKYQCEKCSKVKKLN